MDARRLRFGVAALLALVLAGIAGYLLRPPASPPAAPARPGAAALADAALLSVRDQGRLVVLTARYVAAVPGDERLLGLLGRTTFLVAGTVRYGVDLTRLRRADLAWDEPTRTLTVTLPPLELAAPALDVAGAAELGEGTRVAASPLDEAKRRAAIDDIVRQARAPAALAAARGAALRLVASAFALPLRASGVDASVAVRFVDPGGKEEASLLDRPRRLEDALRDRQAGASPPSAAPVGNQQ